MTISRFRPKVGRRFVRSTVSEPTATDTYAARAAMQGIMDEFERFVTHVEDQTIDVLLNALEPTFALSQKYVPVDTSKLKNSGYLEEAVNSKGVHSVEMGYGKNGRPDYAATVHENLEYRHKAPTRAKFLQAALEEDDANIEARLIKGLREAGGL